MTNLSSYQPFLIGQGQYRTGLFTYYESWIKPEEAFDILENAFVYRGSLYQRPGMIPYASGPGNGGLVYLDSLHIATGDGGTSYSYNFLKLPVIGGTVTVYTVIAGTVKTMTDNGSGVFSGTLDAGGSTIDYLTGALSIDASAVIPVGVEIWATFGYVPTQITTGTNVYNPIMGIKQFFNPSNGIPVTIVFDTRRASYYNRTNNSFTGLNEFSQPIWQQQDGGALVTTGPITTQWIDLVPYTVVITAGADTATDDGAGSILPSGNISGGTVVYATGVITVNFTAAPSNSIVVNAQAKVEGDYFTGDNTNFFNATNFTFNDEWGPYLFATNNVDPITLFNGTQLARPLFNTTLNSVKTFAYVTATNDTIGTCLDIEVYKNRLLLLRPTFASTSSPVPYSKREPQTIRWSIEATETASKDILISPFNFAADVPGNGGFRAAPTGDWLMVSESLRDLFIVFFQRSTWLFKFTGVQANPFVFQQINSTRQTDSPYGTVVYDAFATSMGAIGLIYCDGVAVDRYDEIVIDQIQQIHQNGFGQCFAENSYASNQTWLLFPSFNNDLVTNDSAFLFNILEKTWAIYRFQLGTIPDSGDNNYLSCLGLGLTTQDITWEDLAENGDFGESGLMWSQANFPWNGYLVQTLAPALLSGDQAGTVYLCNFGSKDNGNAVKTYIRTKRLNPFIQQGRKCLFGYLDIYYLTNNSMRISVNFYLNNAADVTKTTSLQLDGDDNAQWAWKRIYLNMTGEFVQIEITNEYPFGSGTFDTNGTFQILGMILHAAPAGRLTPGTFI